jgi:hypothetical protein
MERNGPLSQEEIRTIRIVDTDIRLPASASNVWLHELSFQDAVQMIRFDARINEARAFSRQVLGRAPAPGAAPNVLRDIIPAEWWAEGMPAHGEGGVTADSSRRVELFLAPRNPTARVWVSIIAD